MANTTYLLVNGSPVGITACLNDGRCGAVLNGGDIFAFQTAEGELEYHLKEDLDVFLTISSMQDYYSGIIEIREVPSGMWRTKQAK